MHIRISTISGVGCELSNVENFANLQEGIESALGIPASEQKLIFNHQVITSEKTLEEFGIEENSEISLSVSLEGGAKGKKKKKDVKKNKKKHVHKKEKLHILKYYKVDGDKVVRLKQMCKVCPPGTFIAEHQDRLYCGRCKVAYTKVADKGAKGGKGGKKDKGDKGKTAAAAAPVEEKKGKGKGKKK